MRCERVTVSEGEQVTIGPFQVELSRSPIPSQMAWRLRSARPLGWRCIPATSSSTTLPCKATARTSAGWLSWGREGIMVLLADSTGAERLSWTPPESSITSAPTRSSATPRTNHHFQFLLVAGSRCSSSIWRTSIVVKSRWLVSDMRKNVETARKLGYLDIPRGTLVDIDKIKGAAADKQVIITTGAQGSRRPLARMASGRHRDIDVVPGDTVIPSSTPIPATRKLSRR